MAHVVATAPGKLVVLGEYAVLKNAPALVMAVDRRCRAEIVSSDGVASYLRATTGEKREVIFRPQVRSGLALVDRVVHRCPAPAAECWSGALDSSRFFREGKKMGLGSSAAALTAWSGAWMAWSGQEAETADTGLLRHLVEAHRADQGGVGSGVDVAASLHGGVIRFQLDEASGPRVSAARLPSGVEFVSVFVRSSASTRAHVARFQARAAESPSAAAFWIESLTRLAEAGVGCAVENDADGFLGAIRDYAGGLQALGEWMGAEIFTPEHLDVMKLAQRFGVAYKVSGAGGGDLGLAFGGDLEALARFREAAAERYDTIELAIDPLGLDVEILSQ